MTQVAKASKDEIMAAVGELKALKEKHGLVEDKAAKRKAEKVYCHTTSHHIALSLSLSHITSHHITSHHIAPSNSKRNSIRLLPRQGRLLRPPLLLPQLLLPQLLLNSQPRWLLLETKSAT